MLLPRAEDAGSVLKSSSNDVRVRDLIYYPFAYLSISLCSTALLIIALLFIHPVSRPTLDRVSFRMFVYALCGTLADSLTIPVSHNYASYKVCPIVGSVSIFGSHVSSFLFFCIGLNLQLVMVHAVDGQKAEKYYVGGSLTLALILGISTFVSKLWTFSPMLHTCWVHSSNPTKQIAWQIANQHFWNFLVMLGELVAFISVLVYMLRLKVFDAGPARGSQTRDNDHPELSASRQYQKPRGPKQYRNIVLRIALYPLLSLTTLGIVSIGNVYLASRGLKNRADSRVLAIRAVQAFRGTLYTLVACLDPSLWRAFRSLYQHYRPTRARSGSNTVSGSDNTWENLPNLQQLELGGVGSADRDDDTPTSSAAKSLSHFDPSPTSFALPERPEAAVIVEHLTEEDSGRRDGGDRHSSWGCSESLERKL
ncbi:hypothetical protein PQX77_015034 [Marasmius sp. AFHP31]|nr:hypothetical protein PQX77_015034 [Marasmius sp. AFHP31]